MIHHKIRGGYSLLFFWNYYKCVKILNFNEPNPI